MILMLKKMNYHPQGDVTLKHDFGIMAVIKVIL